MQQISSKNFEKCQHCIFIGFSQKFYSFYAFWMAIFIVGKFQKFFPKFFGNFPFFLFPVKIGKVFPVLSRNWKYFPDSKVVQVYSCLMISNTFDKKLHSIEMDIAPGRSGERFFFTTKLIHTQALPRVSFSTRNF